MSYLRTHFVPLLVLSVGVSALYIPPEGGDDSLLRPIATRSQSRRICAELCLAGLGGRACGADCVDLVPSALPVQFDAANGSEGEQTYSRMTRHGACRVLCDNNLGRPLCNCESDETDAEPDYVQVCTFYCIEYDYRVFGCQHCSLYNATIPTTYSDFSVQALQIPSKPKADYNTWCQQQCKEGNGGVACNCDILPMLKSRI